MDHLIHKPLFQHPSKFAKILPEQQLYQCESHSSQKKKSVDSIKQQKIKNNLQSQSFLSKMTTATTILTTKLVDADSGISQNPMAATITSTPTNTDRSATIRKYSLTIQQGIKSVLKNVQERKYLIRKCSLTGRKQIVVKKDRKIRKLSVSFKQASYF